MPVVNTILFGITAAATVIREVRERSDFQNCNGLYSFKQNRDNARGRTITDAA